MRIAVVSESFYPASDESTVTLQAVLDRLVDTGHEVCLVAPGPGLTTYRGCPVVRVSPLRKPGHQVRAALEAWQPDLVQVCDPGIVGRKALKHATSLGIRTATWQLSPVPDLGWDSWRAKVADRSDLLLVTARWQQDRLRSLGVDAELWLPGVDSAAFTPALRDPWLHGSWSRGSRVVVGYVGGLHRRHGVRRLVELAQVPGIRPVIIGSGPQRGWLQARLPQARFVERLSTGDLAVAMASLDVLVHPGDQQTCAHALRAAGAAGVPTVAPRRGAAADVVVNLGSGLLHDPDAPFALARAVASVAADSDRTALGRHGRDLALARTWPQAVDELLQQHLAPLNVTEFS